MKFSLDNKITEYFSESSPKQIKTCLEITQGIFEASTTNLNKVKEKMGRVRAKPDTSEIGHYTYMMRFFEMSEEEKLKLIKSIVAFVFFKLGGKTRYLILDGLSWEHGSKKVHLLVLSILVGEVSVPIWWIELDKKGKSSYEERKRLMDKACSLFDLKGKILLADREYDGRKWFNYLKKKGLEFIIRLKRKAYRDEIDAVSGTDAIGDTQQRARYSYLEKLAYQRPFKKCGVRKFFQLGENTFTFVVFRNPKEEEEKEPLIYFISSLKDKKKIVRGYRLRWKIECCFKHLQSNGFNLDKSGFKDSKKIELLMALVVFLYVCALIEGFIKY